MTRLTRSTAPLSTRTRATLLAAALGLSFAAAAQTPAPHDARPSAAPAEQHTQHRADRHADRHAGWLQRHAERQAALKTALQLTPAQEPAWQRFVAATQPPAQPPQRPTGGSAAPTTPERLERLEAMKAERDRAMGERHAAIRAFYGQLTPSQQQTFDAQAWPDARHAGRMPHRQGHFGRDGHS